MSESLAGADRLQRELGIRIRSRRLALGLTLEALESSCGVGAAFVGQIERGVKKPSLATLARVARGLDVSLAELLSGSRLDTDGDLDARKMAALLRGHQAHEREFLYAALRHLSRRLRVLSRLHPDGAKSRAA